VLSFWRQAGEARWWTKDDAFDDEIRSRFLDVWQAARAGKLDAWQETADGTLALVIVLDQFPRNMFRNDSRAFATDALACAIAHRALAAGLDEQLPADLRAFLYMPLMHSEQLHDQERCVALFERLGNAENTTYAIIHADIIRRFGRFPHRNRVLGRVTSQEEQAFLDSGGFSG
jgi:uncharacterized protein (DUF924 family)